VCAGARFNRETLEVLYKDAPGVARVAVRMIACIEHAHVIEKIPSGGPQTVHTCTTPLTHLDAKGAECEATRRPPSRAPPQRGLFDNRG